MWDAAGDNFRMEINKRWVVMKSKWHAMYVFAWYPPAIVRTIKKPNQNINDSINVLLIIAVTINIIV